MKAATEAALARRVRWSSCAGQGVTRDVAAHVFRFLARHCPRLRRVVAVLPISNDTGLLSAAGGSPPSAAGISTGTGGNGRQAPGGSGAVAAPPDASEDLEAALCGLAARCPGLVSVVLVNGGVTDAVMASLGCHCKKLQRVVVGRSVKSAAGPGADVADPRVTDAGLAALAAGCPHLHSLSLLRCPRVTADGLRRFSGPAGPRLRSLALRGCGGVLGEGLAAFVRECGGALVALEASEAAAAEGGDGGGGGGGGGCFTPEACAAVAVHCPQLRTLRLDEEESLMPVIDEASLCALARSCHHLSHLELRYIEAGDSLLDCVAASHCAAALASLVMDRTTAGDAGVARVAAACEGLRELRVVGSGRHAWVLPSEMAAGPGVTEAGLDTIGERCAAGMEVLDLTALEPAHGADDDDGDGADDGVGDHDDGIDDDDGDGMGTSAGFFFGASSGGGGRRAAAGQAAAPAPAPSGHLAPLLRADLSCGLRELRLDWLKAPPARVQGRLAAALRGCRSLGVLCLAGYQGDVGELLAALASAGAPLQRASLQHTQVGDAGLRQLAGSFPETLCVLHLAYCRAVTDEGLAAIGRLRRLECLDLYQVPMVTAGAISDLARSMAHLSKLYLGHHTATHAARRGGGLDWGGARGAGAGAHLRCVAEAAAARRALGRVRLEVVLRDPSLDDAHECRALERFCR